MVPLVNKHYDQSCLKIRGLVYTLKLPISSKVAVFVDIENLAAFMNVDFYYFLHMHVLSARSLPLGLSTSGEQQVLLTRREVNVSVNK